MITTAQQNQLLKQFQERKDDLTHEAQVAAIEFLKTGSKDEALKQQALESTMKATVWLQAHFKITNFIANYCKDQM